jgi:hypothetical protein
MATRIIKYGALCTFDTIDEFADYFAPQAGRGYGDSQWQGGMNDYQAITAARNGHLESVALSEQYLNKFEGLSFQARKWTTVDAIAGGAPNVGAHLAGSPLSMRRRKRIMAEHAPLTIFLDVVSSASISANYLKKRGAAILALSRMLGATRPVQVYVVGGMGSYRDYNDTGNGFCMVKMPEITDLSRSAFCMAHPAAARGMLYGCCERVNSRVTGSWAFNNVERYRTLGLKIYAEAVQANVADCLYVAPPYSGEEARNVEEWLVEMLAKYGAAELV